MTRSKGPYRYHCPQCGREVVVRAAYSARQRGLCLFCLRQANGWTHQIGCPGPDEHAGPCGTI